jgi:hypothetical protein
MKAYLQQQIDQQPNDLLKKSIMREYLQARTLQALQDQGAFLHWSFLGGTALRFLYNLPRYSEDLDFSVHATTTEPRNFKDVLRNLKAFFETEHYTTEIKASREKAVLSAFLKFPGLLFEMGVSPHPTEVLSIKLEVDTNPPEGANTTTTIIRRFVTVNVNHYDKASLLAGKLHAILTRKYTKGRDLYDLVWYLSDRSWPAPNLELLNAALKQSGWKGATMNKVNLWKILAERMQELRWETVADDVAPFLERPQDVDLLALEPCLTLISERRLQ